MQLTCKKRLTAIGVKSDLTCVYFNILWNSALWLCSDCKLQKDCKNVAQIKFSAFMFFIRAQITWNLIFSILIWSIKKTNETWLLCMQLSGPEPRKIATSVLHLCKTFNLLKMLTMHLWNVISCTWSHWLYNNEQHLMLIPKNLKTPTVKLLISSKILYPSENNVKTQRKIIPSILFI